MSACSSSFRDIINISVVSFHCIHSWFIKPWYSLENVEFSQSWRGNALTVFVWTRNNLIFNLKRGAEKKQVQTPLSVCVCVCLRKKHKVEGESGMLCVWGGFSVFAQQTLGGLWMFLYRHTAGDNRGEESVSVCWVTNYDSQAFYAKHQTRTRVSGLTVSDSKVTNITLRKMTLLVRREFSAPATGVLDPRGSPAVSLGWKTPRLALRKHYVWG